MALPADFPVGTYTITLGHSVHAHFNGKLTVTQDPFEPTNFEASYSHSREPFNEVGFSFGINPPSIAFSFTDSVHGHIVFDTASEQGDGLTFGPGQVHGLPPDPDKDDDSWTATLQNPIPPGGEDKSHERHGHKQPKY